ncbi:protein FRIGIDA-like [Durio zibethinus]|uniref:FRIGIDA-like protein n=1 Tax=Durio zibethinus TaxID=66656 RepID=A0A6P5YEU7_DURZI|nr:protein FRIGIDA-like [Durio zibethinus]
MAEPSMPLIKVNTSDTTLVSVKQEPLQSPLSLPRPDPIPLTLAVVKTEPEQLELQQPLPLPLPQPQQPQPEEEQRKREPQFLKSINDLASLSSAIHAFKCRFDELTKHLDFINQAIESKFNEQQHPQIETQPLYKPTETDSKTEKRGPDMASPPKSSRSEIQSLCEMMCSKGLRRYIVTHLSNVPKLREEVPAALKLAPKPDKLVLDCIGRFFLQGIKAYTKDSPMIPARQASVLVLEFFLLMMGGFHGEGKVEIAADLKVEAEKGAVAWRKRLIAEGGLAKASEVDARGLLLFVACFGIPKVFRSEDLGNLLRLCNLRAILDALKGSPVLPDKMPHIIEAMVKNGMHVEAVDVAFIFGLEDKCSPKTILTLFLQESTKAFMRAKQEAQNSPMALRKANEQHLDALKSLVQNLEDRSSDIAKLLGSWQIEGKIVKLEEEITDLTKRIEDKKMIPKRKLDEMGSSSWAKSQEMKRSQFAAKGSPLPKSSHVNGLHEQWTATLTEGVRPYDGLVPNSYDTAISGHVTNYPAASAVPHGSTISSLPENGVAQMVGINGVGSTGMVTSIGVFSASSYSGVRGEIEVDKAGQMMSSSGLPYGWRQGSVGQSAPMTFGGLFGSSLSIEGFVGLPDTTERTSADLYRFADSIGENESYSSSSRRTGAWPTVAPVRHTSYMY